MKTTKIHFSVGTKKIFYKAPTDVKMYMTSAFYTSCQSK